MDIVKMLESQRKLVDLMTKEEIIVIEKRYKKDKIDTDIELLEERKKEIQDKIDALSAIKDMKIEPNPIEPIDIIK